MENRIFLRCQHVCIPAVLSDTVAARDFSRRLPLAVSGTRSRDSYCFPAAIGCFDPEETQIGWKNGDLVLSGGWLRVFFGGEERSGRSAGVMVVARIREADLQLIRALPDKVRLRIERQSGAPEA